MVRAAEDPGWFAAARDDLEGRGAQDPIRDRHLAPAADALGGCRRGGGSCRSDAGERGGASRDQQVGGEQDTGHGQRPQDEASG